MNFNQSKLTKQEWESIEVPLSEDTIKIVRLIVDGFENINISYNETNSLFSYIKINHSKEMDEYLYNIYFSKQINSLYEKYQYEFLFKKINTNIKIKKADIIRITHNNNDFLSNHSIYEFIMIDFIEKCLENKKNNNLKWIYYYFTISKLSLNNIKNTNTIIKTIITLFLKNFENLIDLQYLIYNSVDFIEKNKFLIKYSDVTLYDHQKKIFTVAKHPNAKLILYIAPTGTGKTLTPLGLCSKFKIIYVCAARHVGLALAKSAISINKKIAFAFGCNSSEDIRLHYFAAKEYSIHKKSGSIKKIDNSFGEKVELIICDVRSYLPAMYYMLAHFEKENIISYFDEPTIFLDYKQHPLHETIHKNWKDNVIPNIVLSSATLPKMHEITDVILDFKEKFQDNSPEIYNITSYECKKTIPILDSKGYVYMPHYVSNDYEKIKKIAEFCSHNLTLLRYLDLNECSRFIEMINKEEHKNQKVIDKNMWIERNFTCIQDVNMFDIKNYYITLLKNIHPTYWNKIYCLSLVDRRKYIVEQETSNNEIRKMNSVGPGGVVNSKKLGVPLQKSVSGDGKDVSLNRKINKEDTNFGIYITTQDSYTLTDGATLFITNNIKQITDFCIRQTDIPTIVMSEIMEKINFNEEIKNKIMILEKELDDIKEKKLNNQSSSSTNENTKSSKKTKISLNLEKDTGVNKISLELEKLYSFIKSICLNETFVPNKSAHLKKWALNKPEMNSFTSDINEETVIKIMSLDVEVNWKILLLLGIGVFAENNSSSYNEIIKELADTQKLYLIIANSDYIYGVNYQFCHLYLGKDMEITQEKILQSIGRVGRQNIQQTYSIRFRNENHFDLLFHENAEAPEKTNMNILFTSKNIVWDEEMNGYREV